MIKNKKRADGRIKSAVYLGNGKYKYVYANSQKELNEKVTEIKIKLGKGIDITAERDTFGAWLETWLESKRSEISDKRYKSYEASVKRLDSLQDQQLVDIRMVDIQKVINDNYRCGLAYQTLVQIRSVCKQTFDLAIANRVCDFNPADSVKIPKAAPKETKRALTDEEQQWINAPSECRGHLAAMIMMYAGLRRGELMPLTWKDIDLDAKTISINKAVETVDSRPQIKYCGKTEAALRTVYIPDILVDYLKTVKRDSLLVCPSAHGKLLTETGWKRMWNSYMRELNRKYGNFDGVMVEKDGKLQQFELPKSKYAPKDVPQVIPPITAHWLRHTYITMLYLAGVDVLTAKEQAGHADIKTTMQIYTHLDSKYKRVQIDKLNDYLNPKNAVCGSDVGQNQSQKTSQMA